MFTSPSGWMTLIKLLMVNIAFESHLIKIILPGKRNGTHFMAM